MLPGAAAGNCSRCKEVQVIESWRSNYVNLSRSLSLSCGYSFVKTFANVKSCVRVGKSVWY